MSVKPEAKLAVPELAMTRGPLPVVVTELLNVNAAPVNEMPEPPVVESAPLKVVVPVPTDCKMNAEEMAWVDTLRALVMVKPVNGVVPPTAAERVMTPPVPDSGGAVNISAWAPSIFWQVMPEVALPEGPALSVTSAVKVTGEEKVIRLFVALIALPRLTVGLPPLPVSV